MNVTPAAEHGFYLFETLYGSPETGLRFLDRHVARLSASARELGFLCEPEYIQSEALLHVSNLRLFEPSRVRITLQRSGSFQISTYPLPPVSSEPVGLLLASDWNLTHQCSLNLLLHHKTSLREDYDRGWKLAEREGAFDTLFINEREEITEGGRSNIFVKIRGSWWTPPVFSGVLPGIMRSVLLEDREFCACEKVLFPSDLWEAEEIRLCSSLRGVLRARVLPVEPSMRQVLSTTESFR